MMALSFATLFALVFVSSLLNRFLRRPLVNGWYLGMVGVLALTALTTWRLTAAGAGYNRGPRYGEYVIGFTLLPVLLAAWGARRFEQRKREHRSRLARR